jgi:hypothetical protein
MGWSHALDVAQHFFCGVVAAALKVPRNTLLVDGVAPVDLQGGVAAVYVDNFSF